MGFAGITMIGTQEACTVSDNQASFDCTIEVVVGGPSTPSPAPNPGEVEAQGTWGCRMVGEKGVKTFIEPWMIKDPYFCSRPFKYECYAEVRKRWEADGGPARAKKAGFDPDTEINPICEPVRANVSGQCPSDDGGDGSSSSSSGGKDGDYHPQTAPNMAGHYILQVSREDYEKIIGGDLPYLWTLVDRQTNDVNFTDENTYDSASGQN